MKTAGKVFLVIAAIIALNARVFSYSADSVKPLFNKEYYPEVIHSIQEAEESIYFIMYGVMLGEDKYHPINKLIKELIKSHQRGVKVEVLFELSDRDSFSNEGNTKAKKILEEAGIKVRFDSCGTVTHVKLIIIDGYTTILGSHNWTYSAVALNNETSVVIESVEVADKFLQYFKNMR